MNFANLKKQSKDFGNLVKQVEKLANPTFEKDESEDLYWKPTPDKTGNALAVIRFLPGPAADGDDALPWCQYWDHGFQNKSTGKWYIEKSLTTLNQKDPVSELNSTLWNSSQDDNGPERKQARDQKRRLHYVANILVINDPQNKDAEGKVFLYKFGKKIFDKITEAMNPQFEDEQAINPFDMWEGANFKLKIRNVEGYRNYDKSEFADASPLFDGDDAKLEELWKKEFSLKEFTDKSQFKPYDQVKGRLDKVLGAVAVSTKAESADISPFKSEDAPSIPSMKAPSLDEDDEMDYFKSLADTE